MFVSISIQTYQFSLCNSIVVLFVHILVLIAVAAAFSVFVFVFSVVAVDSFTCSLSHSVSFSPKYHTLNYILIICFLTRKSADKHVGPVTVHVPPSVHVGANALL